MRHKPAGEMRFNERDNSVYSIGQWISPHRLGDVRDLLWEPVHDAATGLYRCVNNFHQSAQSATATASAADPAHNV